MSLWTPTNADVLVLAALPASVAVCVGQRIWPTKRNSRIASYLNVISGGVFLGTALFHILPDASMHDYPILGRQMAYLLFVIGLMFMMFIDKGWAVLAMRIDRHQRRRQRHGARRTPEEPLVDSYYDPSSHQSSVVVVVVPGETVRGEGGGSIPVTRSSHLANPTPSADLFDGASASKTAVGDANEPIQRPTKILYAQPETVGEWHLSDQNARAEENRTGSSSFSSGSPSSDEEEDDHRDPHHPNHVRLAGTQFSTRQEFSMRYQRRQRQATVAYISCVAIAFHSLIEGVILGTQTLSASSTMLVLVLFFMLHKALDTTVLVQQLMRHRAPSLVYWYICLTYVILSPVGVVVGDRALKGSLPFVWINLMSAFGAGSFLYMALFSVLQPEFSLDTKSPRQVERKQPMRKMLTLWVTLGLLFLSSVAM